MDCAEIYKKIKAVRILKGWSQEEIADKLDIAINSYAKIERGETDVSLSRLVQISKTMGVDFSKLLESNGNNIINIIEHCTNYGKSQKNNILITESQCAHELEKAQLLLQEREIENSLLKDKVALLEKLNGQRKGKQ